MTMLIWTFQVSVIILNVQTVSSVDFFPLQLNLVALNQPHSGGMMGLDMADRMCYEQAKAMGLAPNYRAFISSHRQDLVHVVYPGFRETLPVTNLRVSRVRCCFCITLRKVVAA